MGYRCNGSETISKDEIATAELMEVDPYYLMDKAAESSGSRNGLTLPYLMVNAHRISIRLPWCILRIICKAYEEGSVALCHGGCCAQPEAIAWNY